MFVYLVTIKFQGYGTYDAHVVIAKNTKEAKKIASTRIGDEGEWIWLNKSKVKKIGVAITTKSKIVSSSFNAG